MGGKGPLRVRIPDSFYYPSPLLLIILCNRRQTSNSCIGRPSVYALRFLGAHSPNTAVQWIVVSKD